MPNKPKTIIGFISCMMHSSIIIGIIKVEANPVEKINPIAIALI